MSAGCGRCTTACRRAAARSRGARRSASPPPAARPRPAGRLGIADRWADLAVATWSAEWNYGPGWEQLLLDAYGVEPDPERTRYYRLLWDLGQPGSKPRTFRMKGDGNRRGRRAFRNARADGRRLFFVSHATGTGPGEITGDGCSVELYTLLPPFGEAEIVHAAVPEGASILELGCGTGRILRPLAELGHRVHGVDDSPGMLARAAGLPVTRSPIESLRLAGKFDVVLLASGMLNSAPEHRGAFLATCRYHLADDGVAVFQYNPPGWFTAFADAPRERERDGITFVIRESRRTPPTMSCEVEYRAGDRTWTQAWTCYEISDAELTADLDAAGLTFGRWLTEDQAWFTARPRLH